MHDFGLAFDLVSQILKEELLVVVAGAAREHFKAIWCLFTWLDEEEAFVRIIFGPQCVVVVKFPQLVVILCTCSAIW